MDPDELLAHLRRAADRNAADSAPKISPEGAVARLREAAEHYAQMYAAPRFKVGDLVTPIKDRGGCDVGDPHLVVAACSPPGHCFIGDPCSSALGRWLDIRVLLIGDGGIVPFWGQSADYELWRPD
jgi:hypothetical protein